jgi:hypothetical protein
VAWWIVRAVELGSVRTVGGAARVGHIFGRSDCVAEMDKIAGSIVAVEKYADPAGEPARDNVIFKVCLPLYSRRWWEDWGTTSGNSERHQAPGLPIFRTISKTCDVGFASGSPVM